MFLFDWVQTLKMFFFFNEAMHQRNINGGIWGSCGHISCAYALVKGDPKIWEPDEYGFR